MLVDFMVLSTQTVFVDYESRNEKKEGNEKLTHRCYIEQLMRVSTALQPRARQIIKDNEQILKDSS